ncbi:MAG: T9SS type A sorting domain-containing protein [Bacteroidetes bacterium]|nr:T9SS type A sorting domain-containing protein [Bacteroidota bacterium]
MKTTFYALLALGLALGFQTTAFQANAQCDPLICSNPSVDIGNDHLELACVRYDWPAAGQSTWYYTVTSGSAPAISHTNFALNLSCLAVLDLGTWGPAVNDLNPGDGDPEIRFSPDPTTGVIGIKFDEGFDDGETRNYYFTLDGNYVQSEMAVAVTKAGPGFDSGNICGPSETCTTISECTGPCEAPTSVTAVAGSPRSVVIDWEDDECASGWRVCARNMTTGDKICHIKSNSDKAFYGLEPGTTYAFAVRTNCADGSKSPFSTPIFYTAPVARMEASKAAAWTIFPNPASTQFQVRWDAGTEQIEIRLQDVTGALHASYNLTTSGDAGQQMVATSQLAEGLYMLTIVRDGITETKQVSIQH